MTAHQKPDWLESVRAEMERDALRIAVAIIRAPRPPSSVTSSVAEGIASGAVHTAEQIAHRAYRIATEMARDTDGTT